jgi:hypothetical protein
MQQLSVWLTGCNLLFAAGLPVVVVTVLWWIRRGHVAPAFPSADSLPRFKIFMPLRGADPYLRDALQSVVNQDYPKFSLHIVVDSRLDPAWPIVEEFRSRHPDASILVEELRERSRRRSLYCSALTQFFQTVADDECVTFIAADMVVPKDWLRRMGQALLDPAVGGTLGNRWYVSHQGKVGSLVRFWWNAFAFFHMWWHEVVWGGTLAMRAKDIRRSGLADRWSRGMIEDIPSWSAIRSVGLKFQRLPGLVIVNEEEIGLAGTFRFTHRQMQWDRLYHPAWWQGFLMGLACGALLSVMTLQGLVAAALGDVSSLLIGQAAHLWVVLWGIIYAYGLDRIVTRDHRAAGGAESPWNLSRLFMLAATVHLSVVAMATGILRCLVVRWVAWRGTVYRIRAPFDVEMVSSTDWGVASNAALLRPGESLE